MLKAFSIILLVLAAVVCLANPSEAAIRSIDIGLSDNKSPSVDEGQVAWLGYDGAAWQVYLFDGSQIFQLTQGPYDNRNPIIRKGKIIWEGFDGQLWQVFYFNGYQVIQLTNSGNKRGTRLDEDGNAAVWETYDGLTKCWQIWLYENGSAPRQISTQSGSCTKPAISHITVGSQIVRQAVWLSPDQISKKQQVYFFDGTEVKRITTVITITYGTPPQNINYDLTKGAKSPDIHNGQVVWEGWDNWTLQRDPPPGWGCRSAERWSIYLYKSGTDAYKYLSESKCTAKFDDRRPKIWNGKVVWECNEYATDANKQNWDVFYFNGFSNIRWTSALNADLHPVIRNDRTCYESYIEDVWRIVRRDQRDSSSPFGGPPRYISNGSSSARDPDIDAWGRVVWRELEGGRWVIKLFDGTFPQEMGVTLLGDQTSPRIHEGKIVFEGYTRIGTLNYKQIFLWDGTKASPITNDTFTNKSPDIHEGTICWLKENNSIEQVFVWRNGQAIPVTDSHPIKQNPRLFSDKIIWQQFISNDQGIYACPVPSIETITDDALDHQGLDFEHDLAAWSVGTGGAREIQLWDGYDIIPITANGYEDRNPDLRNGRIVWEGRSNGYWQIFLFNGTGVVQLTNTAYDNIEPRLDDEGRVVWQGRVGGNWQIFMFDGATVSQLTTTAGLDKTNPAIDKGVVTWRGQYTQIGSTYYQIYRRQQGQTTRLALLPADCSKPQISNGRIAWSCRYGTREQVFFWDGNLQNPSLVQLTTSNFNDCTQVQISGYIITWQQSGTSDSEIFYYRIDVGGNPVQLTDNSYNDVNPVTDGTHISWCSLEGSEWKVYLSDGLNTVKVTDMTGSHVSPKISDAQLLWLSLIEGRYQVRGWRPELTLLSNPANNSILPVVSTANAAWQSYDGSTWRIYYWDGLAADLLSPSGVDAQRVALDGPAAVWEESDGAHAYVKYFDGYSTRTLATVPHAPNYGVLNPQLHQGRVVWSAYDGHDFEIYLFDGIASYQMTDNAYDDINPQIHNGQLAWQAWDGHDYEIMFWNGSTIYSVTVNDEADTNPQLYMGQVTWQGVGSRYWQVYTWKWQGRPLFAPIGDQWVESGQLLEFEVQATDPNGDPLTFEVSNLPEGAVFDQLTHIFSWTPDYTQSGTYYVFFTASDSGSPPQTTTEPVRITVGYLNQPPELDPIGDKVTKAGNLLTFTISASDPNEETLHFSAADLPADASFDPVTATFSWVPGPTQLGNHQVTFTVTDPGLLSDSETITIVVGDNNPPVLDPIGNKRVAEGDTLTFTVSATDPEGHNLFYSASNLPSGANFDPVTRTFTWTPNYTQAGTYTGVRFRVVDDGVPAGEDEEAITITVVNRNSPPVMNPIGDKTVTTGQTLEFVVTATDIDGDTLNYEVINKPPAALWFPSSHTFRWAPRYSDAGTWPNITFRVTEVQTNKLTNSGFESGQAYPWTVSGTAPTFPGTGAYLGHYYLQWTGAASGTYASQTIPNLPGTGSQLQVSYAFKADAAYSSQVGVFNVTDGTWVGSTSVVTGNGAWQLVNHPVTIGAADDGDVLEVRFYGTGTVGYDEVPCKLAALTDFETITITVNYVNGPPVLGAIGNKVVNWGQTLSFKVHGYDPEGEAMSFVCNPLPSGATFQPDPASPATDYIFTWTPLQSQVGQYPITFRITDAGSPPMSDDETMTITVGDNHPPVVNPIGDKVVNENDLLQFTVSGSDPDGNSLTWRAYHWKFNPVTGRYEEFLLPSGASFNSSTRTFTWKPNFSQHGVYDGITFEATDNGVPAMKASLAITITVNYVNVPPEFVQIGNVWYEIHDQVGKVGQLLQFPVVATDPNGEQITYSLHNAPAGATLDPVTGIFSWTPTEGQQGTYSGVAFMAIDNGTPLKSTTRTITITVIP